MPISLTQEQIREYSEKWLRGTITDEERKALEQWYNEQPPDSVYWNTAENEMQLKERIFDRITGNIRDDNSSNRRNRNRGMWLLAASFIFIIVSGSIVFLAKQGKKENKIAENKTPQDVTGKSVSYIRSITLPDGSIVVLHANSSLNYPQKFSGRTREVTLTGEAYFDIAHSSTPFIIHTGDVKTVVLGTAFNIKAYPDSKDITISVIRGKVRVENKEKVLAVLTPNEQVTCTSTIDANVEPSKVDAASIITDWTKQDMVFEDISFQTVADLLSRRYGVNISFKNTALPKCTIKAFFNGTESLDKVLSSLCLISNSVYTILDGGKIVIDGEGCGE